ncbi:MAG TPA: hypothetical protein VJR23_12350 [Candidatus Acidoferrales bacterium]|nr:hypothetical protein [Candidatus Acidoferrales bacterium]
MFEIVQLKGKKSKKLVLNRPAQPGEIGRPYRYKVPMCVEARPESGDPVSNYTFFPAKDVSTTGFYFLSDALFPVESKIEFVLSFPRTLAHGTAELLRGTGRCVRVEQLREGGVVRYGIGVQIEKSTGIADPPISSRKTR